MHRRLMSSWMKPPYNVFFPSAFTFAHLALAAAASLALTAGLLRRSLFLAAFGFAAVLFFATLEALAPFPLILAHLALAAAAILARAAADMRRRRFLGPFTTD